MNIPRHAGALALAVAVLLPGAGPAAAQAASTSLSAPSAADTITLTLADARRLALARNPAFLADAREADVARARHRQARLPAFNPEADFVLPAAATGGGGSEYAASLGLALEVAGQRGLRSRAAALGTDVADAGVRDAARLRAAEASDAFLSALAARRRASLAEDALALNERLMAAVRTQRAEGEISVLDATLAEIEAGRARARVLAARRDADAATLTLLRLAGLPPTTPLRLADDDASLEHAADALDLDSLTRQALERRPDAVGAAAAVEELRTLGDLARREAFPAFRVSAVAEREADDAETRVGFGLGVSIPLLNRSQGRVAERRAEAAQAELRRQAVELRIRTEVADALRGYVAAAAETAVYERDVLGPARESRGLLETAYREGKIGLPTLLLLRNQLLEAEFGYWDSWLARARTHVALQAATAAIPTEGFASTVSAEGGR